MRIDTVAIAGLVLGTSVGFASVVVAHEAGKANPVEPPAIQEITYPTDLQVVSGVRGWGVKAAVEAWDAAPEVSVTLVDTCDRKADCVTITADDFGHIGWLGAHQDDEIYLNTYYVNTLAFRQATVCHELGHDLGIVENFRVRGTCMEAYVNNNTTPGAAGYRLLADLHGGKQ